MSRKDCGFGVKKMEEEDMVSNDGSREKDSYYAKNVPFEQGNGGIQMFSRGNAGSLFRMMSILPLVIINSVCFAMGSSETTEELYPGSIAPGFDWRTSHEGSEKYMAEILFKIPWGETKGQLPMMRREFKDRAGNRIIRNAERYWFFIDQKGRIIITYNNGLPGDENDLSGIICFSDKGKLLFHRYPGASQGIGLGSDRIDLDKDGNIIFHDTERGSVLFSHDGKISRKLGKMDNVPGRLRRTGNLRTSMWSGGIGIYHANEKRPFLIIPGDYKSGSLFHGKYLGSDKSGNFFILVTHFLRGPFPEGTPKYHYIVDKYSSKNELLARICAREDLFRADAVSSKNFSAYRMLSIDPWGNLYQFWTCETGVEIIKWIQTE